MGRPKSVEQKPVNLPAKKISVELLKRYEAFTETRDEYMDMDVRGAKSIKIAEWATVIKWYSIEKPTEAVSIPMADFRKMMGEGKPAIQYVRTMLKNRFGIPAIRVHVGSDKIRMWSRTPVK